MNAIKVTRMLRLARWLGPWTNEDSSPTRISRRRVSLSPESAPDASIYRAKRTPRRALLLLPGLHYEGPEHPGLDRLARVLASIGYLVMVPRIQAFADLQIRPEVYDQAEAALHALRGLQEYPTGSRTDLLSISFGSSLAIHLASQASLQDQIRRVLIYGGFADWKKTMRFALSGSASAKHDPLNRPVIYMNLLDAFDVDAETRIELTEGWTRFCRDTWGRDEMKVPHAYSKTAREIARLIHPSSQSLFLEGCNVSPHPERADAHCLEALKRSDFSWLNQNSKCAKVRCPVTVIHGRDDDVIPYTQGKELFALLNAGSQHQLLISGLYAHTKAEKPSAGEGLKEFSTLFAILRVLAD